jgi:hypothetical protein
MFKISVKVKLFIIFLNNIKKANWLYKIKKKQVASILRKELLKS